MDPSQPVDGSPDRRRRESDEEDEDESTVRVPNRDRSRRRQDTDRRRRESDEENESTVHVPNRDQSRRLRRTHRRWQQLDQEDEDESSFRVPTRDRSRSPREQRQSQYVRSRAYIRRRVSEQNANWNPPIEQHPFNQSAPVSPGQQQSDTSGTQPLQTFDIVQEVEQYSQVGQQIAAVSDQCPIGTPQVGQTGVQSLTEFEAEIRTYVQPEETSRRSPIRSTPVRSTQIRLNHPIQDLFENSSDSLSNDPFGRRIWNNPYLDDIETPPPRVDIPPPGSPNVPRYQPPRTPPPRYQTPPPRYALQSAYATNTPPRSIAYSPLSFPVSPPPTYTRFYQPPACCQNPPGHLSASLPSTSFQPTNISDDSSEDQRSPQRELHCSPVLSRSRKRRREESGSE